MERVEFGNGLRAIHLGNQKSNINDATTDVTPKARRISLGSEDFCLLSETLISQVIENLRDCDMVIEEGSVTRSGAVGTLEPVYFRDPVRYPVEVMEVVG
ncbi:MAG: VOC family protein [Rhodospirillaceae bacterium TMED63]|nr:MAG: VOC family protein [Rhodospirillaceae bacterium TMED63]